MPLYNIRVKKTGAIKETIEMTIEEMELFEKKNPSLEIAIGAPLIHSGRGLSKPHDGFRDRLRDIKKAHPNSTINTF